MELLLLLGPSNFPRNFIRVASVLLQLEVVHRDRRVRIEHTDADRKLTNEPSRIDAIKHYIATWLLLRGHEEEWKP